MMSILCDIDDPDPSAGKRRLICIRPARQQQGAESPDSLAANQRKGQTPLPKGPSYPTRVEGGVVTG